MAQTLQRLSRAMGTVACRLVFLALLLIPGTALGAAEAPIDTAFGARTDADIEKRLRTLYSNIEPLRGVSLDVSDGIVVLSGRVPWSKDREEAGRIASQVRGVVFVRNEIEIDPSFLARLDPVRDRLQKRLYEFLALLPMLLAAAVLIAISWMVARWVGSLERPFRRLSPNPLLRDLLRQAARLAVLFVGLLLTLEMLDATAFVGALLGTAGIAGIAIGFAFRNVIENYLAGILLSLRQPFSPLDHVRIGPHEGKVVRLTSRATVLLTLDGNHLNVPNAFVFREAVLNFTRNPERRFGFGIGVGMQENLVEAQKLGLDVLREMTGVLLEPTPFAHLEPLGDFSVTIRFYGWVDQGSCDFVKVSSEAIRLVKRAFENARVDMPEPIQRIRIVSEEPRELSAESEIQQDVAADHDLDVKVAKERGAVGGADLLSTDAIRE